MSKVFTITEGVENMGAMKSGGQGSVYKGRRIGEIITAIKILPTPIYSESGDDKNFLSFQNEVQKLKKVNEDANPNVVTILSSGITDSGNFPYIEMEYIDGPDLSELLKPPHDKVFTIQETLKVARHLSNALSHCHKVGVKHGDIKSNNVKLNTHTGNYILLDFGLSVMSDEQRRTSLRQAGAIEFMAPEQHEGKLLFESEVYSFGVILFELLAGTVPFALRDSGESARNAVMVGQLEATPPNLLSLRQQSLPEWWSKEKLDREMQVPQWLISMIYKCLEKDPSNRFPNGMELEEHITRNTMLAAGNIEWGADRIAKLEKENDEWKQEKALLLQKIKTYESSSQVLHSSNPALPMNGSADRASMFSIKNGVILILSIAVVAFLWNAVMNQNNTTAKNDIAQKPVPASGYVPNEEESFQLRKAANLLASGRVEEARTVFKILAEQGIPEAMYEYGNLTLLNENDKNNCASAFDYLQRAAGKGYIPAKRTVGMLYAFGGDSIALKQKGYFGCNYTYDIPKGSKLLMEAAIAGDTTAGLLIEELNFKFGNQ